MWAKFLVLLTYFQRVSSLFAALFFPLLLPGSSPNKAVIVSPLSALAHRVLGTHHRPLQWSPGCHCKVQSATVMELPLLPAVQGFGKPSSGLSALLLQSMPSPTRCGYSHQEENMPAMGLSGSEWRKMGRRKMH